MLKRENRLSRREVEVTIKQGRLINSPLFSLRLSRRQNKESASFALVVSKKTAPSAVQRNFLKRRLREIIKKELPLLKEELSFVVFIKPKAVEKGKLFFRAGIEDLFQAAGLYKKQK